MPMAEPLDKSALEARAVSKLFGDSAALRSVSVRVRPGDAVLVYGPNGAGKTTLLRILASLARPTEGQVFFNGREFRHEPAAPKAAVGFVSHSTMLYGDLTGRENLRFAGRLFGLRNLEKKMEAALELFAVRERANEPVSGLSRGLQQRVALARAFLHEPAFLLLDEPFTGLDAVSAARLSALLARLPDGGKGLIFSTHDFVQGTALASRLVALGHGRLRYDGPLSLAPLASLGIEPRNDSG
jgi:heme exporter protein A